MFTTSLDSSNSSFGLYSAHPCSLMLVAVRALKPGNTWVGIGVAPVNYPLVYEVYQAGGGHLRVDAEVVFVIKGPEGGEKGGGSTCTDLDRGAVGDHLGNELRHTAGLGARVGDARVERSPNTHFVQGPGRQLGG